MPGCGRSGVTGIAGVDTRALTMRIRDGGAPTGVLAFPADGRFDLAALRAQAAAWPGLEGMDLAKEVTCRQSYRWDETVWAWPEWLRRGRRRRRTMSWRWITARSGTFFAAWPRPGAG